MDSTPTLATRFARNTRVLRSDVPLTEDQIARIQGKLQAARPGKSFILSNEVDPSILGGFRIQEEDTIIDASLRHKLSQLKRRLAA